MENGTSPALSAQFFKRAIYIRDLLFELIARDIKLRYKRSVLGIGWSLLNPLAQLLVFNLVFRWILPLNIPNYAAYLFAGLLAWNWFQASLISGAGVIVDHRELVRKPGFPVLVLPVVTVAVNFIHYLLALPILVVFLLASRLPVTPAFAALPALFAIQFIFILSLIYYVATLQVTFRDTQYLLGIVLLLGFYLTPVFYDVAAIPSRYQALYRLNPMVVLIEAYHRVLLDGALPAAPALAWLSLVSLPVLYIGYRIFIRASYQFAEEL